MIALGCFSLIGLVVSTQGGGSVPLKQVHVFEVAQPPAGPMPRARGVDSTLVRVDFAKLHALRVADHVDLDMVESDEIGVVRRVERRSESRFSVFGKLASDPDSFFIITVEDDVAVGLIEAPQRRRAIKLAYLAEGVHEIATIARSAFPSCGNHGVGQAAAHGPDSAPAEEESTVHDPLTEDGSRSAAGSCATPRRHFDVLIYYTPAARMEAGGTAAMQAECQMAVDTTNQVYEDSLIAARMVLVERFEINYTENTDVTIDRDRLTHPSDGFLDGIHGDRNIYGADFVSLFVDSSDESACGIAYCLPSGPHEGFSIVQRGCASNNFTFPHEVGHLQGCAHNISDAGTGCNMYCDAYAHRFFGDSGDGFRTVMGYNNDAEAYTRIGKFSTPSVSHDGVTIGYTCNNPVPGANNAGTINSTTASREDWRDPRFDVWVDYGTATTWEGTFQSPCPSVSDGASQIFAGGLAPYIQPELWIKSGTTSETLTISKPMTIRSCGGSAVIGQL
jgi:hypothetical protein